MTVTLLAWQPDFTHVPVGAVCDVSALAWAGAYWLPAAWHVTQSVVSGPVVWQGVQPGPGSGP
jgi:hypothetical protein